MNATDNIVADNNAIVSVRGVINRFGDQLIHDGVDLDVLRGGSAWCGGRIRQWQIVVVAHHPRVTTTYSRTGID